MQSDSLVYIAKDSTSKNMGGGGEGGVERRRKKRQRKVPENRMLKGFLL